MLGCFHRRLYLIVAAVVFVGSITSCRSSSREASRGVRGGTIMVLRIVDEKKNVDLISVNDNKHAIRADEQSKDVRTYSNVIVSDDLYADLDAMWQTWCKNSPGSEIISNNLSIYEVSIECNRAVNPDFMLLPDKLPNPIKQLIDTVPLPLSHDNDL